MAEAIEEETEANELVIWAAAEEADAATAEVCDAAPLVTDPAPPAIIPPPLDEVAEALAPDEEEAVLSSNNSVGVKACKGRKCQTS